MNLTTYFSNIQVASPRKMLVSSLGVGLFFFIFYASISTHYLSIERNRGNAYHDNDLYFQADSEFLAMKLISKRGYYKRSLFHPLFPVFFNPAARLVQQAIPNPYVVASLFCAFFGSLCVLACIYFFNSLLVPWPRSLLYASFLGLSGSHLVFSTVPDTYIFSAAGLIALMIAVVRRPPVWVWALVSVYVVGINIVNVAFVGIALIYVKFVRGNQWLPQWKELKDSVKVRYMTVYLVQASALFVGLMVIQKLVLNFWLLSRAREPLKDIQYLFIPNSLTEASTKLVNMVEHLFFYNIIPPMPQLAAHERDPAYQLLSFRDVGLLDYSAEAWPSLLIWTGMIILACWSVIHYKLYHLPLVKIAVACFLFNALFFYFYGDDIMLYSCEWTFFLILFVFIGLEKVIQKRKIAESNSLITLFLVLILLNNLYFQWHMFSFRDFLY